MLFYSMCTTFLCYCVQYANISPALENKKNKFTSGLHERRCVRHAPTSILSVGYLLALLQSSADADEKIASACYLFFLAEL